MILTIADLAGRLHPVLVHLPIGILLLACFFQWLTIKQKFAFLQPVIPVALFWGMISAIVSAISGFILSKSGDYDMKLVNLHQWMGISVAFISVVLWLLHYKASIKNNLLRWISLLLIILIIITGHLGGSLTHGSDYLSAAFKNESIKGPAIRPIANINEAVVYSDMVQPLLQARCYTCHGPNKQKGKLRLDETSFILKGGESGETIVPGQPGESEMIERLLLPLSNKEHMPPKEKAQLTPHEIELLHWWISNGADFSKKVKDLQQTDKIKPVLVALQAGFSSGQEKLSADVPEEEVEKADEKVIKKLHNAGIVVMPVARNSNYLSVNFVAATSLPDSIVKLLPGLKKQLVWLRVNDVVANDTLMRYIGECTSLTRLHLSNTQINDKSLKHLQSLKQLQYLNLTGTKVSLETLMQLQQLKNLKNIYLYQTGISSNDWPALQKFFPSAIIDSGNYKVPTLAADTTEVKY